MTGRYLNADNQVSTGSDMTGMNLFAYCGNNPVNRVDPTGHFWFVVIAVVAIIALIMTVPSSNVQTNSVLSASTDSNKLPTTGKPNSNAAKINSNNLPRKGEPGSSETLPNPDGAPKQKRWYGPDGNAKRDRDYNHPGDMPFPHDHE